MTERDDNDTFAEKYVRVVNHFIAQLCKHLQGITGDADQGRAQQAITDPIAAAYLLEYLMIGQVIPFHHFEGFVHAWIEGCAHRSQPAGRSANATPLPFASR